MKVLHIANWYPNKFEAYEAPFIKKQIDALSLFADNEVVHLEVKLSGRWKLHRYRIEPNCESLIFESRIRVWRVIELLHFGLLLYVLYKKQHSRFDLINFHIAYPALVYFKVLQFFVRSKSVITEHWSAYRLNFGIPAHKQSLLRIKKIFKYKLPVITVSDALLQDIRQFSGNASFDGYVVPNVVDGELFRFKGYKKMAYTFLMVNNWRTIKNPFPVLKAWPQVVDCFPDAKLNIGGYGPLLEEMEAFVKKLGLTHAVKFIGKLSGERIAEELNRSHALLYSSDYETFSVICAESLSCGTPVAGPFIPAIAEYVNKDNGIFLQENTPDEWFAAIIKLIRNSDAGFFDGRQISADAHARFSAGAVGKQYFDTLNRILHET